MDNQIKAAFMERLREVAPSSDIETIDQQLWQPFHQHLMGVKGIFTPGATTTDIIAFVRTEIEGREPDAA